MASSKVAVAVVSDLHCGSTLGLMHPKGIQLDRGQHVSPSVFQEWVWEQWLDYISHVKQASKGHSKLYVVVNGDVIDGKPHNSVQVITDNRDTQIEIACDALKPLTNLADRLFITRGTATHEGPESQAAEAVAKILGGEKNGEVHTFYEFRPIFGGVFFDIAHHAKYTTRVPWMRGGAATRLAADTVMFYAGRHQRVPDYVIRAHFHLYQCSGQNVKGCVGIFSAAWQLRTDYAYRLGVEPSDLGGLIFQCDNGSSHYEPILYTVDQEPVWVEP